MRQNALENLGLDYRSLKREKADLIHCSIWGFGRNGTYAGRPAFDDVIQALSGLASLVKESSGAAGFVPTAIADKLAGLVAAYSVAMALFKRERTGEGCEIEVPMLETMTSFLMVEHLNGAALAGDDLPPGSSRQVIPRGPYATTDGEIAVMPYTSAQWQRFFIMTDQPEVAQDPRLKSNVNGSPYIGEFCAKLARTLAGNTTAYWLAFLDKHDIAAARVNSLNALFDDPHFTSVDFFERHTHPSEGPILATAVPVQINGQTPRLAKYAPKLGEHTREVLLECGLGIDEVDALLREGSAFAAPTGSG
jgi:crotonobetainyl-CoA:carnitine CoA-transferase CaiB-like acyl-CoA transferase